jgi:hypothetical protein
MKTSNKAQEFQGESHQIEEETLWRIGTQVPPWLCRYFCKRWA